MCLQPVLAIQNNLCRGTIIVRLHRALVWLVLIFISGCSVSPEPASREEIARFAADKLARATAYQEPVRGPIDLYEAMARAIKYNLDTQVELKEKALRIKRLDLASYKMLPDLVSSSGYAGRSNFTGGNSRLLTGKPNRTFNNKSDLGASNVASSTSQERDIFTQDITFTWNVLDFGLSYVRAKQAANEVLIAREIKRKVLNSTIEAVRTAYWRAVSSQRLIRKLRWLEARVTRALRDTRTLYRLRQTSPITALTFERELLSIKREIQSLEGELKVAKYQLAALMNIPPGTAFTLASPPRLIGRLHLKKPVREMIATAVQNRPEMLEVMYRKRINAEETEAALLELLPGLQLYAGANVDSNEFLFNQHWLSWGAKASWNLIRLFQYPARKAVIQAQDDLFDKRAMSIAMAIALEVHVSRVRYLHARRQYVTAAQYLNVQRRLLNQIRAEANANRVSDQTRLREEMNTLVAEVKRDIAYANVQNAYANVFVAMGLDPHWSSFDPQIPVRQLAASLRRLWIERGDHLTGTRLVRRN